ncbi:MAG: DUF2834 domain-containing protein [Anaerolineae bacterium]
MRALWQPRFWSPIQGTRMVGLSLGLPLYLLLREINGEATA